MIAFLAHQVRLVHSLFREATKEHRSYRWEEVQKEHLAAEPECQACNSMKHLQVHHVEPFAMRPDLELDPANLITLCMDVNECHLRIGHGGWWKGYVPQVRTLAALARTGRIPWAQAQAKVSRQPNVKGAM